MTSETNSNLSFLGSSLAVLDPERKRQRQGERFLQFSLKEEIKGLVSLADLQGTGEIFLTNILPVPQVAECWLGLTNWQGEAIWMLDLAQLVGATNWYRQETVKQSGMAMLIGMESQTLGLLVENIQGIEIYDRKHCLPVAEINSTNKMRSLFHGYFLDGRGEPSMLLNIESLLYLLQG